MDDSLKQVQHVLEGMQSILRRASETTRLRYSDSDDVLRALTGVTAVLTAVQDVLPSFHAGMAAAERERLLLTWMRERDASFPAESDPAGCRLVIQKGLTDISKFFSGLNGTTPT